VDTTQTTHLSLCAGYGGIDLGLGRVIPDLRTVAFLEVEAFAVANLAAKMEAGRLDVAPIWTNLKTFDWQPFRDRVDIMSGGYPCQPFSAAGKRLGKEDPRHLWPYIRDGIDAVQPRQCFFENVEGHISLGLREVLSDLESRNYKTAWGIFSAAEVGAPHQRKRVFILAKLGDSEYDGLPTKQVIRSHEDAGNQRGEEEPTASRQPAGASRPANVPSVQGRIEGSEREEPAQSRSVGSTAGISRQEQGEEGYAGVPDHRCYQVWPSRPGEPQHEWEPPRVVGDTTNKRLPKRRRGAVGECGRAKSKSERPCGDNAEPAEREIKSKMGRDFDGSARGMDYAELCESCDNRTDELRLLGNGVVPAVAERAYRVLSEELKGEQP